MNCLRKHFPVILIVPLVIIALTWPTFPRLFDGDEIWLHTGQQDKWQPLWDVWHIKRVLAGEAELFYTDYMFHPPGTSLAFYHINYLHALLALALQQVMPADNADNLLYLLARCFNAFCAYALIQHLIRDKWAALFGAIAAAVMLPSTDGTTAPSMYVIGTLPLAVYFLHRSATERRWRFAALAGFTAGVTAYISVKVFAFALLTSALYAFYLALSRWKQSAFWLQLLLIMGLSASIAAFRFYPMLADEALRQEGLGRYHDEQTSHDLLDFFVLKKNPVTGGFLTAIFDLSPETYPKNAYLGYINIFLLGCAIILTPQRRKLMPWLLTLVFCAVMRLGHYLTVDGVAHESMVLPARALRDLSPSVFGAIVPWTFQTGVVTPLAVLSCYGLAALLQSKPLRARILIVLAAALLFSVEYFVPHAGKTLESGKLAYIDWLKTEEGDPVKTINLPQKYDNELYYFYVQAMSGYPHAYGFINRTPGSARSYIEDNMLLRRWEESRSVHCLPHNTRAFNTALDRLLADGFSHIVEHEWAYGNQFIDKTFWNLPEAYDDDYVKVYRLRDLRLSCETIQVDVPRIDRFLQSSWMIPGARTSILSFQPNDRLDDNLVDYLSALFSDWDRFLHLYIDDGRLALQSADDGSMDLNQLARESQVIYLVYNALDAGASPLAGHLSFDQFNLCQREVHEDGSVMERYVSRDFACALFASANALHARYENGARLEYLLTDFGREYLDIQFLWSNLPPDPHSVSLQVFDAAGEKLIGQDSTVGDQSLTRQRIDVSSLPPGKYTVKLIFYNYLTGRSVPGVRSEEGIIFERELAIATTIRA
ncbi:MAG: hypothetical protein OXG85_00700 [Chloroflexi bacterium]|nr:hypothetical protein [Chloroflexota bacterium]